MKYQFLATLASVAHGTDVFCENTDIDPVHMLTDAQEMYLNFKEGNGSAEECQTECKNFKGCEGFTFHGANRICRLSTFALMAKNGVTYDQVFENLEDDENLEGKTFGLKSGDASCVKKEPWKPIKVLLFNYSSTTRDNITWYQPSPRPLDRMKYYNDKCGPIPGKWQFRGIKPQCEGFFNCPYYVFGWPNCNASVNQNQPHISKETGVRGETAGRPDILGYAMGMILAAYFASSYVCRTFMDLIDTNNGVLPVEFVEVRVFLMMLFAVVYMAITNLTSYIQGPPTYYWLNYLPMTIRPFLCFFPILQIILIEMRKTWKTFNDYGPISIPEWIVYFLFAIWNCVSGFGWVCTQCYWPAAFNIGGGSLFNQPMIFNHPLHPNTLRFETRTEQVSQLLQWHVYNYLAVWCMAAISAIFLVYAVYQNRDFWKIAQSFSFYLVFILAYQPTRIPVLFSAYGAFAMFNMKWGCNETFEWQYTSTMLSSPSATFQGVTRGFYGIGCYMFVAVACAALMLHMGLISGTQKYWFSPDFQQRATNMVMDTRNEILHFTFFVLTLMIPIFHQPGLFWEDPDINKYITAMLLIGMVSFALLYLSQEQTGEDFNDWSVAGMTRLGEAMETVPSSMRILLRLKYVLFWSIMLISDNMLFLSGVFGGKIDWGSIDMGFDFFSNMIKSWEVSAYMRGGNWAIIQLRTECFLSIAVIYALNTMRLYLSNWVDAPLVISKQKKLYKIYLEFTDFTTIFLYVIMLFTSFRIMLRGFKCVDDINNPGGVEKVTWAHNYRCYKLSGDAFFPHTSLWELYVIHTGFFISFWFILFASFRIVASRQRLKLPELTQNHFFIIYQTLSRLLNVLLIELVAEGSPGGHIGVAALLVVGHVWWSIKTEVVVGMPLCTATYFAVYVAQLVFHVFGLINMTDQLGGSSDIYADDDGGKQGDVEVKSNPKETIFMVAWIIGVVLGLLGFFIRVKMLQGSNKTILGRVRVISNVQWDTGAIEPVEEQEEEKDRTSKMKLTAALGVTKEDESSEDLVLLPRDLTIWDIGAALHTHACFGYLKNALDFESVIADTQDPVSVALALEGSPITTLTEETILRGLRLLRRGLRCDTGRHALHFKKRLITLPIWFLTSKSLQIEAITVLERITRDMKNLNILRTTCYQQILRAWAQVEDPIFHTLAGLVLLRIGKGRKIIAYNNRKDDSAPNYSSLTLEKLSDDIVTYVLGGAIMTFVPIYPSIMGGKHVSLWHPSGEIEDVSAHGGYNSSVHKFTSNDEAIDSILIFPPYSFLPPNLHGGQLDGVKTAAIVGGKSNAVYLPCLLRHIKEAGAEEALRRNPVLNNFLVHQFLWTISQFIMPLVWCFWVFVPPKDSINEKPDEPYKPFNEKWDDICWKSLTAEGHEDTGRPTTKDLYFLYFEEGPDSEAGDQISAGIGGSIKLGRHASIMGESGDGSEAIMQLQAQKPPGTKMLTPARGMTMNAKFVLLFMGKITPFSNSALFRSLDTGRTSAIASENFGLFKDLEKFKSVTNDNMDKKRKSCVDKSNDKVKENHV